MTPRRPWRPRILMRTRRLIRLYHPELYGRDLVAAAKEAS